MAEFFREQTKEEKKDFIDVMGKSETSYTKFLKEMGKHEKEARNKMLPFARNAAMAEFDDKTQDQKKASIRKNGYLDWMDIKPIKIDFAKYSDLKNFNVIGEGEEYDPYLSKHNPGLNIALKYKKYQYKGFHHIYIVMEEADSAIQRAIKKKAKLEKELA